MLFSVVQWAHRAPAKCFTWPEVQWPPLRCPHRYLWVKNQKQESSTKDLSTSSTVYAGLMRQKNLSLFIHHKLSGFAADHTSHYFTHLSHLKLAAILGGWCPCWDDFTAPGHHSPPEWDANRLLHCGFPHRGITGKHCSIDKCHENIGMYIQYIYIND